MQGEGGREPKAQAVSRYEVHADAFVPERNMEYKVLISANPYNILCVGIEKSLCE